MDDSVDKLFSPSTESIMCRLIWIESEPKKDLLPTRSATTMQVNTAFENKDDDCSCFSEDEDDDDDDDSWSSGSTDRDRGCASPATKGEALAAGAAKKKKKKKKPRFQVICEVSSPRTDDMVTAVTMVKYARRLAFTLDEVVEEMADEHEHRAAVGDLINRVRWLLCDLDAQTAVTKPASSDQLIVLLQQYDSCRRAYYSLRDRLKGMSRGRAAGAGECNKGKPKPAQPPAGEGPNQRRSDDDGRDDSLSKGLYKCQGVPDVTKANSDCDLSGRVNGCWFLPWLTAIKAFLCKPKPATTQVQAGTEGCKSAGKPTKPTSTATHSDHCATVPPPDEGQSLQPDNGSSCFSSDDQSKRLYKCPGVLDVTKAIAAQNSFCSRTGVDAKTVSHSGVDPCPRDNRLTDFLSAIKAYLCLCLPCRCSVILNCCNDTTDPTISDAN